MPNSPLLPYFVFSTLLISGFALTVIVSLVIQKQRQVRNRLARQQMAFDFDQSLLNTRIEVRENTLSMLASELHDNILQSMTLCQMGLSTALNTEQPEEKAALINEAKQTLTTLMRDTRMLSHSLASGMVENRPLEDAIQAELSRIQALTNIQCNLELDTLEELPPNQRLLLFRAVQEALQNTLKHAKATRIDIRIYDENQRYFLSIADNGKGFDPSTLSNNSLGLMSLRQRAALLNGNLHIKSSPGAGTIISLELPIPLTNGEN
ncbi:MAG: sensor histidine kinase [Chitinophagaceae bacterium]